MTTRRHPADTAILAGLAIGHIAVAVTAARMIHAFVKWSARNV